jgi:dienelactone hydrolase
MRPARETLGHSVRILTALSAGCLFLATAAGTCPASAAPEALPAIADTIRIAEWHCLGPFSVGPREGITGLADAPEQLVPPDLELPPAEGAYPSMLARGGSVRWMTAAPDSSGWVNVKFDNVSWDTLAETYGAPGLVNTAYAYCCLESPAEARALVVAERVGSFYINGVQHVGDPYGNNFVRVPVVLRQGENRIMLRLSGYGDPGFRFEILPPPAALIFLSDYTTPDIIRGEQGRFWVGIPVVNTAPETIDRAILSVGDGTTVFRHERVLTNLTSLCVRKVPVEIEITAPVEQGDTLIVPIEIACEGTGRDCAFTDTLRLRIREPNQSFKRTFISRMDCSCQYYAVLPPAGYPFPGDSIQSDQALIFTLHGAGVRAEGQVDAYKSKPWAFIVAPTNRRPFGFDWQDWGRLDALEVLAEVEAAYPIDPDRVYLTGHSMGGHGVWHVGLSHPDLFAAMGPGAGWTSFGLYVPWFLQKSAIYAQPGQIAIRNAGLREDETLNFVDNAANLPVFIFQGGADDNVPPTHARMFAGRLDDLGYDYRYKEIPGLSHWWSIDSLGTSCVDDPDLMAFFQSLRRNSCPSHVVFKTSDLGKSRSAYWLEIDRQEVAYRDSRIEATAVDGPGSGMKTLRVRTENVDQFTVAPCSILGEGPLLVAVDGERSLLEGFHGGPVTFSKRAGGLRVGAVRYAGLEKSPDCYGPIKQAYFSPFVLVYGTAADSVTTGLLLNQARLEAWQWFIRGNGFAEILADSQVTSETIEAYNLIVFGGPGENRVTAAINRHLPISIVGSAFRVGSRWIQAPTAPGRGIAAEFVYPNPLNGQRLVFIHEGIGPEGLALSTFFGTLYSAAGLPDFLIFDDTVRKVGWAGTVSAGFFTSTWKLGNLEETW